MSDPTVARAPSPEGWSIVYEGFDPAQEPLREALCALGNGRFASRGCAPEAVADGVHYPGTYAAGLYNRLTSEVMGREVADESNVNLPNWLPLSFRIEDGEWFDASKVELAEYRQELDLRRAVLTRKMRFKDAEGRESVVAEHRLLSMANPNVFALQTTLLAVNWSGRVTFRSALDGRVSNGGVARYRGLASHHLAALDGARPGLRDDRARGRDEPVAHPRRRGRADATAARRRDRPGPEHCGGGTGLDRTRHLCRGGPRRSDHG